MKEPGGGLGSITPLTGEASGGKYFGKQGGGNFLPIFSYWSSGLDGQEGTNPVIRPLLFDPSIQATLGTTGRIIMER